MDWTTIVREFIALWVVIDPIGSIPVFIAVCAGLSAAAQRKVAIRAIVVSAAILLFFLVGGQVLLEALDIHLAAFQIAGGILLGGTGMSMLNAKGAGDVHGKEVERPAIDRSTLVSTMIVPVTLPLTTGAGTISTVTVFAHEAVQAHADIALFLAKKAPERFPKIVAISPNYLVSGTEEGALRLFQRVRPRFEALSGYAVDQVEAH